MPDDLGGDTRDQLTLRAPLPAEPHTGSGVPARERANRRYGRACFIAGVTTLTVVALVVCAIPERHLATMQPAELNTLTTVLATAGAAFLTAGLVERLTRYNRALLRQVVEGQEELSVAAITTRLDRIEQVLERVPDYGKGVVEGMAIRRAAAGPEWH